MIADWTLVAKSLRIPQFEFSQSQISQSEIADLARLSGTGFSIRNPNSTTPNRIISESGLTIVDWTLALQNLFEFHNPKSTFRI